MTNEEYEAACITAAKCYDRFEGEHKLRQIDEIINNLETSLANLHEQRREIVNQYNLNKCKHDYVWHTGYARWYCSKCEATK
ncbi:TPA: hypothetical protein ACJIW3_004478 [Enterobacter hormaechei]